MTPDPRLFRISDTVSAALAQGAPVVALESTVITHGLPYPANLETARALEATVRHEGATPATIAVLAGQLCIGLADEALVRLARLPDAAKLSRADLAICMGAGRSGGTTVAATMIAARRAGIEVFATGGIGGVHPGAETSFDISADLHELARSRLTVVCAGAKAILDLPRTLEVLETLGVPVIAYGQDDLPGFWSRSCGLRAPQRMDTPGEIAAAHRARVWMEIDGGQLVANPVPQAEEIPLPVLAPLIAQAQAEATAQNVTGKAVTPFLLARLAALTDGRTVKANQSLIRNNARLGARVAIALAAPAG